MDKAKEAIVQKLKASGCRITKQRLMLLDIILEENCSCCKEIYYRASRIDPSIGTATVYRMINKLEEIGAINRRNMYKVACDPDCDLQIQAGLKACGYVEDQKVRNITVQS